MLALLSALVLAAEPHNAPMIDGDIRIDGRLDEPEWQLARPLTDFARYEPTAGGQAPGSTEVRLLQDNRYLYVGISVTDSPSRIRARISPREAINADDQVSIYLDTFRDGLSGYIFYFNPLGIQQDIRIGTDSFSFEWNTLLKSRGQVSDHGYVVEVAIPFRSLKYPAGGEAQEWGVIHTRKIPAEGAKYAHPQLVRNHPRLFAQAHPLVLTPPKRGSGVELIPSLAVSQSAGRETREVALQWSGIDPWYDAIRPGLDVRLGVTPNIGLAAAINPDFSQVEGDVTPIALNQRFAFFFPEQRPFFLDGSSYFGDPAETLYSRSIADPVYGVKLSGREGRWSVGVVHALDRSPAPTVNENGTPGFDDVEGALAFDSLARVRMDAFGQGYVGVVLADKRLVQHDTPSMHSAGGLDVSVPVGERWTVAASTFHSLTGPSVEDLTWGQGNGVSVSRSSGVGTGFSLEVADLSAGVRQELGFLTQSALTRGELEVDHTFTTEGVVDRIVPGAWLSAVQERNGDAGRWAGGEVEVVLGGIHTIEAWGGAHHRVEEGVEVLGWETGARYEGDFGRTLTVAPWGNLARVMDFETLTPALASGMGVELTLRPTAGIRLDTSLQHETKTPEDRATQTAIRARNKLTWQFTRELGMRLIGDYTNGSERAPALVSSALLTWLLHPGTAVYLGYTERTDLTDRSAALQRGMFAKFSVLIRP